MSHHNFDVFLREATAVRADIEATLATTTTPSKRQALDAAHATISGMETTLAACLKKDRAMERPHAEHVVACLEAERAIRAAEAAMTPGTLDAVEALQRRDALDVARARFVFLEARRLENAGARGSNTNPGPWKRVEASILDSRRETDGMAASHLAGYATNGYAPSMTYRAPRTYEEIGFRLAFEAKAIATFEAAKTERARDKSLGQIPGTVEQLKQHYEQRFASHFSSVAAADRAGTVEKLAAQVRRELAAEST